MHEIRLAASGQNHVDWAMMIRLYCNRFCFGSNENTENLLLVRFTSNLLYW